MADIALVNEYIQPLSQKWSNAVERFLDLSNSHPVPEDNSQHHILQTASVQLRKGMMISDEIVWGYMSLLRNIRLSVPAIFMDTYALRSLRSQEHQTTPSFRCLKPTLGSGSAVHVFWPIHHEEVRHWSLVHVDVRQKTVTSYDSYSAVGERFTIQARKDIFYYWTQFRVNDEMERASWQDRASSWDRHAQVQAIDSNDCAILCLLLMRFLRAHTAPPELPIAEEKLGDVMRWVGGRMRHRVAAELLAGQANPPDELIPMWLECEDQRP